MKTQFEKLQSSIKVTRGNVKKSLVTILETGECRTGESARAYKRVWTDEVTGVLSKLNIPFESGNDAPRGGAFGEYVRIRKGALRTKIMKNKASADAQRKAEIAAWTAAEDIKRAARNARIAEVLAAVPNDQLREYVERKTKEGKKINSIAWRLTSREGVFSPLKNFTTREIEAAILTL